MASEENGVDSRFVYVPDVSWMMRGMFGSKNTNYLPRKEKGKPPKNKRDRILKEFMFRFRRIGLLRVPPAPAGTWENRTLSCQLHNDQWINFNIIVLRIFNIHNDCQQTVLLTGQKLNKVNSIHQTSRQHLTKHYTL